MEVNLRGVIVAVFAFDCRTLIACYNIVNLVRKCELTFLYNLAQKHTTVRFFLLRSQKAEEAPWP